jgi:NADH-quinone oxidoreductase subunit H
VIYFVIKVIALFFLMVWIRGVFPRLRVDQLMGFAWKFLLPLALVNIFSTSLWIAIMQWGAQQGVGLFEALGPAGSAPRIGVAYVVTGAINIIAFIVVLRINSRRSVRTYQGSPSTA